MALLAADLGNRSRKKLMVVAAKMPKMSTGTQVSGNANVNPFMRNLCILREVGPRVAERGQPPSLRRLTFRAKAAMLKASSPNAVGLSNGVAETCHRLFDFRGICSAILLACEKASPAGFRPAADGRAGRGESTEETAAEVVPDVFSFLRLRPSQRTNVGISELKHSRRNGSSFGKWRDRSRVAVPATGENSGGQKCNENGAYVKVANWH